MLESILESVIVDPMSNFFKRIEASSDSRVHDSSTRDRIVSYRIASASTRSEMRKKAPPSVDYHNSEGASIAISIYTPRNEITVSRDNFPHRRCSAARAEIIKTRLRSIGFSRSIRFNSVHLGSSN